MGKRYKPEEIVAKLRQVDVLTGQGSTVADAVRQIGVTDLCARHGVDHGGASPLRADWPEPLVEGNCVVARRGGEEALDKTRS